jgi:hypothetical protein
MHDFVTAHDKEFDQDVGRVGNADLAAGCITAATKPHLSTNNTDYKLLEGLPEEEVRLRRANDQGNNVKLPTSRFYGQILRENIVTLINLILFARLT